MKYFSFGLGSWKVCLTQLGFIFILFYWREKHLSVLAESLAHKQRLWNHKILFRFGQHEWCGILNPQRTYRTTYTHKREVEMKTNRITSSAGLDKKHLWLVLEQRTVRIVKSLEDPVQLKNEQVTYVGYTSLPWRGIIDRKNETIMGIEIIKRASTCNIIMINPTCRSSPSVPYIAPSTPCESRHTTQLSIVRCSGRRLKFSMLIFMPYTKNIYINKKDRCKTDELQVL